MNRQVFPNRTTAPPTQEQFNPPAAPGVGFRMPGQAAIGTQEVLGAIKVLQRYKEGKANLDARVTEAEQWYKLRHWDFIKRKEKNQVEPTSAWLFNSIANKHAEAMDNYPSANVLPREIGDKEEAHILSQIIPTLLDQTGFEQTFNDEQYSKIKYGTGIYGVFWDSSAANGLGDVSITEIDIHDIFWEPGIKDIQKSRNIFHIELVDTDLLAEQYPQLADKLQSDGDLVQTTKYIYDDNVECKDKTAVIDWYYKKRGQNGKTVLHYCKFAGVDVLFATENEPQTYPDGWYTHGQYPFVFDPLYRIQGTPCGLGYVDIGKDCQTYIDRMDQGILRNVMWNSRPRYLSRQDGNINEDEFANLDRDIVHVTGNLSDESIRPIQSTPFSSLFISHLQDKVQELKETTGNRDVSTGGTTSGVTAASAIAALIETGSKLSRDSNKGSYRAFRSVVVLIIELIRQFYDIPRFFRVLGQYGTMEFVEFSNIGLIPQYQGVNAGIDMGYRVPLFDINVTAEKQSPYSKISQNELALQFYQAGFFMPENAIQALAVLEMMDFDGKDQVQQRIAQNFQMLMGGMAPPGAAPMGGAVQGDTTGGESAVTQKARARTAEATAPR